MVDFGGDELVDHIDSGGEDDLAVLIAGGIGVGLIPLAVKFW